MVSVFTAMEARLPKSTVYFYDLSREQQKEIEEMRKELKATKRVLTIAQRHLDKRTIERDLLVELMEVESVDERT